MTFIETIQKYPISYKKFEEYSNKQMIEAPGKEEDWRECIYKFINHMAFRVYIDYLPEQQVLVQLNFAGNFVSAFEGTWIINEIYKEIFDDAFEYMEKWFQEVKENSQQIQEIESKGRLLIR